MTTPSSPNIFYQENQTIRAYKIDIYSFQNEFKARLSHSKKYCWFASTERPLKMMKNAFYFISKAFFRSLDI